jgi:hypothetical protein
MEAAWRCSVRRLGKWILVAVFVILAPSGSRSQQTQQGDIFESGGRAGGGCDSNSTHFPDRCAYEKANLPCNPLTKQFGMPDHVPKALLAQRKYNQYAHCGGDACDPTMATCWGWCGRPNKTQGDLYDSKGNPIVAQGDVFESGGNPAKPSCDVYESGGRGQPPDVFESGGKGQPPDVFESGGRGRPPSNNNDKSTKSTNTRKGPCDLQHLAALIMTRYGTGRPIATYKVVNTNRNSPNPTYLVTLSGVEDQKPGQANLFGDALIAFMHLDMLDSYRAAILDALQNLPRGANLILAGHSQGGMEAQTVAEELIRRGFKIRQVISYGAPILTRELPGTNFLHVRAKDEPLQALDQQYVITKGKILLSNPGTGNFFGPDGSHNNYDKPSSGLNQHGLPQVFTLATECYDIDLTTMRQYEAPTALNRVVGKPNCQSTQNSPGKCTKNTSWSRPAGLPAGQQADPSQRGLLLADENYLKTLASTRGLIFLVRDSSLPALKWIGQPGYKAKPSTIKGKTLKEKDLEELHLNDKNNMNQYLGLASAKGMSQADRQKLQAAGYRIGYGLAELILDKDGNKFYSDTDLHGVYDTNGKDAWSSQLGQQLKCSTIDQGIQHDPHDDWVYRNVPSIAGANVGPQIGDGKTITAILPDCTTLRISTLAEMKQLYRALGINFNSIYPNY